MSSSALRLPANRARLSAAIPQAHEAAVAALAVTVLASQPLSVEALGILDTAPAMTIATVCDSSGRCTKPSTAQLSTTDKLKKDAAAQAARLKKDASKATMEAQKTANKLTKDATRALPVDAQKAVNKAGRNVELTVNKVQRDAKKEAKKMTTEVEKVTKGAVKLVPKDVQQAAGKLQKMNEDGGRVRNENLQKMFK